MYVDVNMYVDDKYAILEMQIYLESLQSHFLD
jgi:hypothetical protein